MEMLSSKHKIAIVIASVFVVGIFIFYITTKTNNYNYSSINKEIEEDINKEQVETDKEEENNQEIVIHITGAVKDEGIVKLISGARIADAIEEAGGLTDEANLKNVNLAYALKDGQKIYIPKISDIEEDTTIDAENGQNVIMDNNVEENEGTMVNINTATMEQLQTLSGIGEGTASKIIEYRQANGKFKSIDEIKNVSGIGDLKYENIKNYICI